MLNKILDSACLKYSAKTALIFNHTEYTYGQLQDLANRLATSLLQLGLKHNDRVAFYMPNCPEAILCFIAGFKIGATLVPIRANLKPETVIHILHDTQTSVLICAQSLYNEAFAGVVDCYIVENEINSTTNVKKFSTLIGYDEPITSFETVPQNTIATIAYTSGSTDSPKGVMHNYYQLSKSVIMRTNILHSDSEDRVLIMTHYAAGYCFSFQILPTLYMGATILLTTAANLEQGLDYIQNGDATLFLTAPTVLIALCNKLGWQNVINNKLRAIISSADILPLALHRHIKHAFGVNVYEGIGMTETMVYALNPLVGEYKIGSRGLICPEIEVAIFNQQNQALAVGEIGEIVIKGYPVLKGYFGMKALDLHDGWFHSGDLGYFDKDGYLWFKCRIGQELVRNNITIYPFEVENCLYEHAEILEAVVININANLIAFVSLKNSNAVINKKHILQHAKAYLNPEKVPDDIIILKQIPKGVAGKVDRKALQELYYKV